MDNLWTKIIELLNAVYWLSDENRQKLNLAVEWLSDEDKKEILVAVYKRYEAFERNLKKLERGIQKASNDLDEIKERRGVENVLLSL